METERHIRTAKRFAQTSVSIYDEGFYLAAGEMVWGATIQAVCALAHIAAKEHPHSIRGNRERYAIISGVADRLQTSGTDTSSAVDEDIAREIIVGILHDRFNSGEESGR